MYLFKKIKENHEFRERILCGIILALLTIIYNFVWINKTFTMSEGWSEFYVGLLKQGQVPYRDFYYYMPPLNLLVDYILWKLSFGYFIIYRLWRLAERILIIELMYILISKRVHTRIALIGCFLAVVLSSADVYDLGGDYNQTNQLLIVLLCLLMEKYIANIDDLHVKIKWIFAVGICGGCMFLLKQPLVLANAITFSIFMLFLVFTKREKHILHLIIAVVAGMCIPLGICFAYLGYNHAIQQFIYQVFLDTSSKGSLFDIILGKFNFIYRQELYGIWALICFFAAYISTAHMPKAKDKFMIIIRRVLMISGIFLLSCGYSSIFKDFLQMSLSSGIIILFVSLMVLLIFSGSKSKIEQYCFWLSICICFVLLLSNVNHIATTLYSKNSPFFFMATMLTFVYILLILWCFYHIITNSIYKNVLELDSLVLVCGGIASGYTTIMTNGEAGVVPFTAFISIPVFIYIVFRDKNPYQIIHTKLLKMASLVIFTICLSQKLVCAYAWWGDTEDSYWDKCEVSQIEALKGFRFSEKEKKKYDEIYNVIFSNSDKDDVIWGFPHAKVYNIFANNYNMNGFVPVLFYDVCTDDAAVYEAELLSENAPDIVVWIDIPNCMEVHERMFRGGGSFGATSYSEMVF